MNCAAPLADCVGSGFAVKKTEVRGLWQGLRRKMRCRALLQADLQRQDEKISPEQGTETNTVHSPKVSPGFNEKISPEQGTETNFTFANADNIFMKK